MSFSVDTPQLKTIRSHGGMNFHNVKYVEIQSTVLMINLIIDVEALTTVELQSNCFDIVARLNSTGIISLVGLTNS